MLALDPRRFHTLVLGYLAKRHGRPRGDHRLVVGCLEQCAMGAFDPKFILHRYSGDNPVDCSWDTCGDWPCFKRYAMASSDYGAVDFADDRPLVITASGLAFFFADIKLVKTYWGIILAHAVLGTPFVIITVTATLSGFDKSLTRASANMGQDLFVPFSKCRCR